METASQLITTKQAARILRRGNTTLSRWVQDERIVPALRAPGVRGAMWFRLEDVERLRAEEDAKFADPDEAAS